MRVWLAVRAVACGPVMCPKIAERSLIVESDVNTLAARDAKVKMLTWRLGHLVP